MTVSTATATATLAYNPKQARVPKGNRAGGNWMDTPGGILEKAAPASASSTGPPVGAKLEEGIGWVWDGTAWKHPAIGTARGDHAKQLDEQWIREQENKAKKAAAANAPVVPGMQPRPYELKRRTATGHVGESDRKYIYALRDKAMTEPTNISLSPNALAGVAQSGKFKTLHETRSTSVDAVNKNGVDFSYYRDKRKDYEERGMGAPQPPVYGWIGPAKRGQIDSQYGSVVVTLRHRTKTRTTVTFGDSLDSRLRPLWTDELSAASDSELGSASALYRPYTEAQIHGGVTLADIKSVSITAKDAEYMGSTLDTLRAAGVEVIVGRSRKQAT